LICRRSPKKKRRSLFRLLRLVLGNVVFECYGYKIGQATLFFLTDSGTCRQNFGSSDMFVRFLFPSLSRLLLNFSTPPPSLYGGTAQMSRIGSIKKLRPN
jgi:hypothetical protein